MPGFLILALLFSIDLLPGTQIALWGERMAQSERVMVTILGHVHDWSFLCKYHEEVVPRRRVVGALYGSLHPCRAMAHLYLANQHRSILQLCRTSK